MGLSDFTNTPQGPGGPGSGGPGGPSGGGPGGPPPIPVGPAAQQGADLTDIMINYNERYKNAPETKFRDMHIEQALNILISKNKPNPIFIGSAGVGKTQIAEEIARRIANKDQRIPKQIADHTVWELPLANLIAGAGIVGQVEERVTELIDFASDPKNKVILFIDEIHMVKPKNGSDPTMNKISQILKPALARGDMRVIGATTSREYRNLEEDPAFARRFSTVIIDELTVEQTRVVLETVLPSYIAHYNNKVTVDPAIIPDLVTIADQNSKADAHRPDNTLTLLDRTMANVIVSQRRTVAETRQSGNTALADMIEKQTMAVDTKRLLRVAQRLMTGMADQPEFDEEAILENMLTLVGQDDIIEELMDIFRRENLAIFPRTKPLTLMFAGPSGVGKTASGKNIAQQLTQQEPIILNMAEYTTEHSATKLIGAPPGYVGSESNRELPFTTLTSNPHRVIILDELEKAHTSIHDMLLSAIDQGWMDMADNTKVDFTKSIIIATTNAGREKFGKSPTGFAAGGSTVTRLSKAELTHALESHFKPEFLGRFSTLIQFNALSQHDFLAILQRYYEAEWQRIADESPTKAQHIPSKLTDEQLNAAAAHYVPQLGARPAEAAARKLMEDMMLDSLAAASASNDLHPTASHDPAPPLD